MDRKLVRILLLNCLVRLKAECAGDDILDLSDPCDLVWLAGSGVYNACTCLRPECDPLEGDVFFRL